MKASIVGALVLVLVSGCGGVSESPTDDVQGFGGAAGCVESDGDQHLYVFTVIGSERASWFHGQPGEADYCFRDTRENYCAYFGGPPQSDSALGSDLVPVQGNPTECSEDPNL